MGVTACGPCAVVEAYSSACPTTRRMAYSDGPWSECPPPIPTSEGKKMEMYEAIFPRIHEMGHGLEPRRTPCAIPPERTSVFNSARRNGSPNAYVRTCFSGYYDTTARHMAKAEKFLPAGPRPRRRCPFSPCLRFPVKSLLNCMAETQALREIVATCCRYISAGPWTTYSGMALCVMPGLKEYRSAMGGLPRRTYHGPNR